MPKQFTLSQHERLKSRKAIEQLFQTGQSFVVYPFKVNYRFLSECGLKFGVSVSRRIFNKATQRNRLKRLIREAYRLQKLPLQKRLEAENTGLHVFFIYTAREVENYDVIFNTVKKIIIRLEKCLHEFHSAGS